MYMWSGQAQPARRMRAGSVRDKHDVVVLVLGLEPRKEILHVVRVHHVVRLAEQLSIEDVHGNEVSWTLIAFEAGQVSAVENLTCFKDIYDKYAPFMSEDDAEVLRKCCEAADNR